MNNRFNHISKTLEAYVLSFIMIMLFLIANEVGVDISLWWLYIAVAFTGLSKGLKT